MSRETLVILLAEYTDECTIEKFNNLLQKPLQIIDEIYLGLVYQETFNHLDIDELITSFYSVKWTDSAQLLYKEEDETKFHMVDYDDKEIEHVMPIKLKSAKECSILLLDNGYVYDSGCFTNDEGMAPVSDTMLSFCGKETKRYNRHGTYKMSVRAFGFIYPEFLTTAKSIFSHDE